MNFDVNPNTRPGDGRNPDVGPLGSINRSSPTGAGPSTHDHPMNAGPSTLNPDPNSQGKAKGKEKEKEKEKALESLDIDDEGAEGSGDEEADDSEESLGRSRPKPKPKAKISLLQARGQAVTGKSRKILNGECIWLVKLLEILIIIQRYTDSLEVMGKIIQILLNIVVMLIQFCLIYIRPGWITSSDQSCCWTNPRIP